MWGEWVGARAWGVMRGVSGCGSACCAWCVACVRAGGGRAWCGRAWCVRGRACVSEW